MNRSRRAALTSTIALATSFFFASFASAIDLEIPIPFLNGGRLFPEYNAPPVPIGGPRSSNRVKERVAPVNEPLDLSPMFSDRLPYSVALGRVVVESNFPLESVHGLEAEIVQLQRDLVGFLGVPQAREKIELCLFADMRSYRDFIAATFPGAPTDRPALYVKDSGPGVLMVPRDARMILNIRHEMTHAYLNASLRNVPIWIDEGLAKYFEIPPGERGFRNPYLSDVEQNVSGLFSSPPSLSRLEKLTTVDQMKTREYRESWSWVHYMIHYSDRTHRILASYLRSLTPEAQEGISPRDAYKLQKKTPMKKALEKYEPGYLKEYVEHFKNWEQRKEDYESGRLQPVLAQERTPTNARRDAENNDAQPRLGTTRTQSVYAPDAGGAR